MDSASITNNPVMIFPSSYKKITSLILENASFLLFTNCLLAYTWNISITVNLVNNLVVHTKQLKVHK